MILNQALQEQLSAALVLHQAGRLEDAQRAYEIVLQTVPDHPQTRYLLAQIDLRRSKDTLATLDQTRGRHSDDPEAYRQRGIALHALGRSQDAILAYDRAIELAPHMPTVHYNRGNALLAADRADDALLSFGQALRLQPDYLEARYNSAVVYYDRKRFDTALALLDVIVRRWPDFAPGHNLRGNTLMHLCRPADARVCYESAIAADPTLADAHNNLGSAVRELGDHGRALISYRHALRLKPDFAEAHWNVAVAQLLLGDFSLGWMGYEWRKRLDRAHPVHAYREIEWDGRSAINGLTLLVYCEQGYGDTIQFCRYTTMLAGFGAKIKLLVQQPLVALLRRHLVGIEVIDEVAKPPAFDLQCALLSLPLALATDMDSIPKQQPYFRPDPTRRKTWLRRLGTQRRPRIGIAWSGNPAHINDHNRSIPLAAWRDLIALDAEWFSVQKDLRPSDARALSELGRIVHLGDHLENFEDTAALIALMDLVISVDTSVAHLAGVLGKPVWLLVAATPDWRWLLGRADSPWYPTMRVFRQPAYGDWASVIADAASAVCARFGIKRVDAKPNHAAQ